MEWHGLLEPQKKVALLEGTFLWLFKGKLKGTPACWGGALAKDNTPVV